MSLADVLTGPECGVDVYEETDEQRWVNCASAQNLIGLYVTIPIIIIVVLLMLWFGSPGVKIGAVVGGSVLLGIILLSHIYWVPLSSRVGFQRAQKEINSRVTAGMTRTQAIQELQKERLKREEIAATKNAANTNASANLAGMAMMARAIGSKK